MKYGSKKRHRAGYTQSENEREPGCVWERERVVIVEAMACREDAGQ